MTDFSPLEGALMVGCGPADPLAPAGRVVRGGSADGLRVNMKSPNAERTKRVLSRWRRWPATTF